MLLSCFSRVRLCATPLMAAHEAPPSLGFSRQEHWSGLPFPSPTWDHVSIEIANTQAFIQSYDLERTQLSHHIILK